jgi:hypothetical protein
VKTCQSCRQKPVDITDYCDDAVDPYQLCHPCHQRLVDRALRPLEYFNLVAKHGSKFLLHDDFYDSDGTAEQPETEVEFDKKLAFPLFTEVKDDLEKLLDYAIVMGQYTNETTRVNELLKSFDKQALLASIERRTTEVRTIAIRVYPIVAEVPGPFAADWVRKEWQFHTPDNFTLYAECLAKCLPSDEGVYLITEALDKITNASKLSEHVTCLMPFQNPKVLDWIEQRISRVHHITNSWGYVAAASAFTWGRAQQWLQKGRPLSLIALDALVNCATTKDSSNMPLWLRKNPPTLLVPDTIERMSKELEAYVDKDNVVRTRQAFSFITTHWEQILKTQS